MNNLKIFVAGHKGMVGSAIVRLLQKRRDANIIVREKSELDLKSQIDVFNFLKKENPDQIYIAAAKVGGIHANNIFPAQFIYENLIIESNIIHAAFLNRIKKILFLGSSCIYPKFAKQPMKEDDLLTGSLEPTNEPYAIAKIAGIKLCESYNRQYGISHKIDYRSVMPTNLYGPGDNYHPENSHVIPALIRKFHEAKVNKKTSVTIWGTGSSRREFLYVDDLAKACLHVMNINRDDYTKITQPMCSHINVGSGIDLTIEDLAKLISKIIGFNGKLKFDHSKPDGMPRKLLDSQRINNLGWSPEVNLNDGVTKAYNDFKKLL